MSEIPSIAALSSAFGSILPAPSATATSRTATAVEDSVEISQAARVLSESLDEPEIRLHKIAVLREAIERGDYLTTQKLDQAIAGALDEL